MASALLLIAAGLVLAATTAFAVRTLRGRGVPPKPRRRARLGQRIRRAKWKKQKWRRRGILRARGLWPWRR